MTEQKRNSITGWTAIGLCILCIILKLTGFLVWPWIWILSPIWIPVAITIILLVWYKTDKKRYGK